MVATMPWHKKRVYYDRESERRRRDIYRLDISILLASALLLIVIVAGLISRLFIGFFVNPVLYEMVARDGDVLQV